MKSFNFSNLKERVTPLALSYSSDGGGGYKENWQTYSVWWAYVTLHNAGYISRHQVGKQNSSFSPYYKVVIRCLDEFEKIKGFLWKKKLLRVVQEPSLSICRRFSIYLTKGQTKDNKNVIC